MQFHSLEIVDLREQVRAALIHQARQPLFALQNYLSAASQVANRLAKTPDIELMQKCLAEMRSSIEKSSLSLTKLADWNSDESPPSANTILVDFIKDTFHLASFVIRRLDLRVQWKILPKICGSMMLDAPGTQFELIRWIFDTCTSDEFKTRNEHPLLFSAEPCDGDVIVRARCDNRERSIRVGSLVSEPRNRSDPAGGPK